MIYTFKMEPGSHPQMWCQTCSYISDNLNFRDYIKLKNTTSIFFFFWTCPATCRWNLCPMKQKLGILTTGPPGKIPTIFRTISASCRPAANIVSKYPFPYLQVCNILNSNQFLKKHPYFLPTPILILDNLWNINCSLCFYKFPLFCKSGVPFNYFVLLFFSLSIILICAS